MYTGLLLLCAVLVPIPLIIAAIRKKEDPYKACVDGAIGAGVAMVLVYILAAQGGSGIGQEIALAGEEMTKMLPSDQRDAVGALFEKSADGIPGTMLILAALCSYGEYILLSRIVKTGGEHGLKMPPIRELHLSRSVIRGWLIIIILSWVIRFSGFSGGTLVMVNVNILFEFTFALQGISLLFLWTHLKKVAKAVPVIATILLWFLPAGMTLLFIAGLADLFVGLRKRIIPR